MAHIHKSRRHGDGGIDQRGDRILQVELGQGRGGTLRDGRPRITQSLHKDACVILLAADLERVDGYLADLSFGREDGELGDRLGRFDA